MLEGNSTVEDSHFNSALVSRKHDPKTIRPKDAKTWCDHCQKPYHTKETCWLLHGKPPDWKPRSQRKAAAPPFANIVESVTGAQKQSSGPFSDEQMNMLKNMLSQFKVEAPGPSTSTANIAHKGNGQFSFLSRQEERGEWILDSGATDHMTGSCVNFKSYSKADRDITITVADGNSSLVAGVGDLNLSGLELKSVLHVPELKYSLISVSKLTKDLNCAIIFYPSCCIFQDLSSWMTIGSAKERSGLYFVSNSPLRLDSYQTTLSLSTVSDSNVFLWYNRLGHPNFTYLNYLYPDLFIIFFFIL